ncbi:hypothetical protein QNK09_19005 [Brevibacillus agri]|uniref:hypothetical protein n=1 Tax=Brevibacillus agri TaxID=51101 RepID=UPI0024C07B12|nr:hypothetical protein [Brevibacillus agri]WHX29180.1 hypothetical protein QNK09_19005 [Brevibacillus agri]
MSEIYEYLDSVNIKSYKDVFNKFKKELTKKDKERLINFLFTLIKIEKPEKNSLFNFTTNSTLAGFPNPCSEISCRIDNLEKLARFASLYADSVFIPSPFDKYLIGNSIDSDELIFDICTLIRLRPLVENGIIKFTSEFLCVCEDCLRKNSDEKNKFNEKMDLINDILEHDYLNLVTYKLNYEDKRPFVEITGPEKYISHGNIVINFKKYIPQPIKDIMKKGQTIELPHDIVKEIGVIDSLISPITKDIYQQNTYVNLHNLTYLTNREVDVEILNALHTKSDFEKSNILVDGLTHLLPILQEVEINKIVELRLKDGESFAVYRDTLTSIINDRTDYTLKELKEIYKEKIYPELNKINLTIKRNKKNLTGSIVKDVLFASSIISIGLYSGILPPDIGKIVAAIGGTRFLYELYNKIGKAIETDEEIKKSNYYFLWKLQNS